MVVACPLSGNIEPRYDKMKLNRGAEAIEKVNIQKKRVRYA